MRNISTILSVIALLAVGVLYYLDFSGTKKLKDQISTQVNKKDTADFRIAYFDIDSLQHNYNYFKDAENQMKDKENAVSTQLGDLEARYQRKIREWQEKGANMTQSEGEAAQREYQQMQQTYQQTKYTLEQQLQKMQVDLMTDLRQKVEEYLVEFNEGRGYAYIFSYQPGFIIYYKDSAHDITPDLIAGLNAEYKAKKKK